MEIRYRVASVTSNLGDEVDLPEVGVTCIVGANNVGKSRLLKDLRDFLIASEGSEPLVLAAASLAPGFPIPVDPDHATAFYAHQAEAPPEVVEWLHKNAGVADTDYQGTRRFSARGTHSRTSLRDFYSTVTGSRLTPEVAPFLLMDQPNSWGHQINSRYSPSEQGEFNSSFLAMIHRSREMEEQVSDLFNEAFGERLIYDQATGAQCLRLGSVDPALLHEGRFTNAYTTAMGRLRRLEAQGSGMQAFMAAITPVALAGAQVYLFDEPETYLHPPQARALGRQMGRLVRARGIQVVAVTHDRDFIVGLTESDAPLKFVRVAREGAGNRLAHVGTSDVEWIWRSAVLRYSNVLDGLFYQRVIVCESEADCRYYSAVLDGLLEAGEVDRQDCESLFVGSSGKAGAVVRVRALALLHVQISVVLDFDIFIDDPGRLRSLIEALGHEWTKLDTDDFNIVKQDICDNGLAETIKRGGLRVLSTPKARRSASAAIERLGARGVFVVPAGEMEAFEPLSTHKKEPWVDDVLQAGEHLRNPEARAFVRRIVGAASP